jgi:SAM-dependent methyltransferase
MEAWSRFWRQGHATTFGDYFDKGYAGPVKQWLDTLPDLIAAPEGALNVLELCCGNGSSLPFLFSLNRTFDYVGVDAAEVALPSILQEPVSKASGSISLLANTPVESLPESIQGVSLCFSLYGMEYSDLAVTLKELLPRMDPNGQLFALLHHEESIVAQMSRRAVGEYEELDIERIRDALTTIHETLLQLGNVEALKANDEAEKARKFMNGMGNKYLRGATLENGNAFMADHVMAALRFFKLLGQASDIRARFIDELAEEAQAARERHQQMLSVAKTADDMETLVQHMTTIGWNSPRFNALTDKDGIIGWTLTATA